VRGGGSAQQGMSQFARCNLDISLKEPQSCRHIRLALLPLQSAECCSPCMLASNAVPLRHPAAPGD
jgi:hypothetical protein